MLQLVLRSVLKFFGSLSAAMLGMVLALAVARVAGEDPLHVARVLWNGAFGNPYSIGMTLFYAAPLLLTGLAVALPFHAGLFNIGAEGQLTLGALGVALVGAVFPSLPGFVAIPFAMIAALLFGGAWGGLAGALRAWRGGHEVISTIMLNFVAAALSSWVVLNVIRGDNMQSPESAPVGLGYLMTPFSFFEGAPTGPALVIAILATIVAWFLLKHTSLGFSVVSSGDNEEAAFNGGVRVARSRFWIMSVGGAMAGLVGLVEVLGNAGRFKIGFSPDYGFTGIAVALLARCHPLGVIPAALLFGALHRGCADLDLETDKVTRDLALVMQACIIGMITIEGLWRNFVHRPARVKKPEARPA